MAFEIVVVSNTPLTPHDEMDDVALRFLRQVGYLDRGADDEKGMRESVAYKLFRDCFLLRPEKTWTVEELISALDTSRPTIYRHLNKLKALDILEESSSKDAADGTPESRDANARKTYRLRYGNLAKAWTFVEANVKIAMENYRKSAEHLHAVAERNIKENRR
jgi:DNA-binding transcriptional ArsR family regulator